jgi:hypothetical protein
MNPFLAILILAAFMVGAVIWATVDAVRAGASLTLLLVPVVLVVPAAWLGFRVQQREGGKLAGLPAWIVPSAVICGLALHARGSATAAYVFFVPGGAFALGSLPSAWVQNKRRGAAVDPSDQRLPEHP